MKSDVSSFWSSGAVPLIEPEMFSSIIAVASDIALVVDSDGKILSVTTNTHESPYGDLSGWEGQTLFDVLTAESIEKTRAALATFQTGTTPQRPIEVNHVDPDAGEFPVRYSFHAFADDAALLMLGRDQRPVAETQRQLIQAQMSLEKGYEARREFDARYRLLLRTVRDAVVFVSVGSGRILDVNEPAATLLGQTPEELVELGLADAFRDRRREELIESLVNAAMSESSAGVEVQTRRNRARVTVMPSLFRAAGERVLICRLTTADAEAPAGGLDINLKGLFEASSDAMLFCDPQGQIRACNDAFLDMVDAPHAADVTDRSLAEFLGRGQIDLSVLLENAKRSGQMRMYATKLTNQYGVRTAVEMSVAWVTGSAEPEMACIIRDTSRTDSVGRQTMTTPEDSTRNVMELVGSASLKEIVSETTEVVEKMCIETAVSLTRNNRVAAAEMLGLSRQSLYVKLRKYGLLSRDGDSDS